MTDQPIQANGAHENTHEPNGVPKISEVHVNPAKIEIQVATKKKKQVINLESSSEKLQSKQASSHKPFEPPNIKQTKKPKVKKIQNRCQLCKGHGKKVQMKKCNNCKLYAHIHCIDENQAKGKYICIKCKSANQAQQSKALKKLKKQQEKLQIVKASQKKLDKQKKKDQSNRILQKFKQKYPFYIGEGDKIKFPIQDKLLFIYRDYFEISETKIVPTDHPLIPTQYLGDLLEIQNFIVSFGKEFQEDYNGQYRKSVLYVLLNCDGTDKTFERLLGTIIKIYLKDIFEKNKTENVKILNDNSFFILLGTINEAQQMTTDYVAMTAPQIIKHLSNVPSMKNSFQEFSFPEKLNLKTKLKIIVTLIQGLSQVDGFHDMVSRKSEKISEMTKDKADFVVKLKKNEADALSKKQQLKQMMGKVNKLTQNQTQTQKDKNIIKQVQKTKKKTQKLANDGQVSQKIIKQFKSKIVKITRKIPFVISQIIFLGCDRNNAEYFFYLREPHRVYVKYKNYLMDESDEYKIYENKQKIIQLLKTMNTKGAHQKRLYDSINNLVKQQIIRNLTIQDDLRQQGTIVEQPMDQCCFLESDSMFRQKLVHDVMQIQQNFSNYLTIKNYRWAPDSRRQQFRFGFPYIEDIQAMKDQIRNLQESFLFVQVIKEKQVIKGEESQQFEQIQKDVNQSNQKQLSRRKKPIRIWGINSERIKKFWVQYLETCDNYVGIWITVNIFKKYVDNYLQKKMQHIREQERKQNQQRQRQQKQKKIREQKQKQQRSLDRLRSRDKPQKSKGLLKKNRQHSQYQEIDYQQSPQDRMKTRRNLRGNSKKSRPLTIDSDDQIQYTQQYVQDQQQQSDNDDQCAICKDTGQVICCDTCPKVYHLTCLGLKQLPQGQWSCMECLHRISNQRQTRSKAKKMGK